MKRFRLFTSLRKLYALPLIVLISLSSMSGHAQVLYGTLVGNVTDSAGLPVPSATVVATNMATGISKTTVTDSSGAYRLTNVDAGTYKISIAAKSFASTVGTSILVQTNTEKRFDAKLLPASVGQTVTVTGAPPELQTDTATVGFALETTQVQTLVATPGANMRNFQSLYMLIPGFTPPTADHSEAGNPGDTLFASVNGVSGSNNNTRIDGVSDIYAWLPEIAAYSPSTEAIASVNVVTNSPNAEQGFASGAVINVATKSGTNDFHGTAWEYNMISALEAKGYYVPANKPIPKYIMNQFGANYGGPIRKNKAFFFANWERTRRSQAVSGFQTVPTTAMINGDFSGVSTAIYDPSTGNQTTGAGRTQFSNNMIPSGEISYAAQQMAKLMTADAPNVAGAGLSNNFFAAADAEYTRDNIDSRVDYTPNSSSTIFGRYGIQKTSLFDPQALGKAGGATLDGGQPGNAPSIIQSVGMGGTYTFRPNLVADANFGYLRQGLAAKNTDIGTNWGLTYFNIPGTNGPSPLDGGIPRFSFTDISALGNSNNSNPFQFRDNTYVSAANLSWTRGKHSTRYGMEFQHYAINHFQPQNTYGPRGGFNFSGGLTSLPGGAAANGYNAWADFLLGLPNLVQKDTQYLNPATIRESVWAFYAQDQWQITDKLTFTYGVRYEYYPIATRDHSGLDIFNPNDGKIYILGAEGVPSSAEVHVGKGMIVPRIGLAYRLDQKTVVRAGFGISTNPDSYRNVLTSYPSVVSQTIQGASSYVSPIVNGAAATLVTGIPAITPPTLGSTTNSVALGTLGTPAGTLGATTLPLNYRRGYYESYNAAIERELPGSVAVQATYVGDLIIREVPGININASAPGTNVAGEPLNQAFGISAGVTSEIPMGTGHYNGLQMQAKRRFSADSTVGVNYTYSRSINDYGDASDGSSSLLVAYLPDWRLNRAVAGFDRTHNLQIFGNYMLPFGRGKSLLQNGAAGFLLGGWGISGVLSRESGTPFTVTGSAGSLSAQGSTQFADQIVPKVQILGGHDSTHPYFNTADFADPSVAELAAAGGVKSNIVYRFGTAGRNSVRGPGFFNLSTSLARTFRLTERFGLVFRAEAFNLTNTPSFANPASNVSSASGFGIISSTQNNNRELRLSGRLNF
ncbi:hypothetical protein GCM10011507_07000 [Edaphobacter acidisoli]|uniref:TonB-dependent transporter Oar-like beta-barrel domain-containing protein n=1 Tax=Edaphobacter acidisoli TaxID=2040573 RepID=A0A916W0N8_9BACT|nr:TonB-dependent receptor [Edaphobacter acidisoli]GGA58228.1 hypothetical protein GCM10011507_07000 [Edaphobacter acidisoli]